MALVADNLDEEDPGVGRCGDKGAQDTGGEPVLLDVLTDLLPGDVPGEVPGEPSTLDGQLARWARNRNLTGTSPALALSAVLIWTRLHGLVSLEIESNFASMGLDPELLFEAEVAAILDPHAGEPKSAR